MYLETIITLCIATLVAFAVFVAVWSYRAVVTQRIERDVQWLAMVRLRFTPEPRAYRRTVIIIYLIQTAVVLPLLLFLLPTFLAIGGWLLLWLLPSIVVDIAWKKRLRVLDEQLPATIKKMANLCSAGLSPADALQQLAVETPLPIRYEYRIMAREWAMGANLADVLQAAAGRLPLESFRLLANAVTMNTQVGGNLVKTLEELGNALNTQFETYREIDAAMAEGKMNVLGLLLAPPVMLLIITFIDSEAVKNYFTTLMGLGMFAGAMVLVIGGALWARRISRITV